MLEITLKDGFVNNYEIITFFSLNENNNIIVYTDGKYDNGKLNTFIVKYNVMNNSLNDITNDLEKEIIFNKLIELGFEGI